MKRLLGTGVALVTPFTKDFCVDVTALQKIVEYTIQGGIDYLVVLGTTGESAALSKAEKELVVGTVVSTNAGRLPLVLGIGGNNTYAVAEELKTTDLHEFDAVLSVSPYYSKPTQEGIYQHFKTLAEVSPKPIILYNVPSRTGSNMTPETIVRLANDFDTIVAVKEASGDMVQVMRTIQDKPKGFHVISGDDITALATVLAGGSGVISVLGQGLPIGFSNMVRLALQGRSETAYEIHYSLQKAMSLIFKEGNPAGIKAIFETLKLSTASVRLPLVEASRSLKKEIADYMDSYTGVNA